MSDLKYTQEHEWLRREADGSVTLGITDYAQEQLGDIVFVELPAVGVHLDADQHALLGAALAGQVEQLGVLTAY